MKSLRPLLQPGLHVFTFVVESGVHLCGKRRSEVVAIIVIVVVKAVVVFVIAVAITVVLLPGPPTAAHSCATKG